MLCVAELGLRILYPDKALEIAEQRQRIENVAYRFEPEYLVALKPNLSKTYKRDVANGGDVVRWTTNRTSFRGPELRSEPDMRVIVYGDSNIQARCSKLHQTFPYKLEEYLASLSRRDVEVVNGGIIGSGPDQVLIRFSSEIELYEPDIVIFHVYADNDLGDIVRNRLFELDALGGPTAPKRSDGRHAGRVPRGQSASLDRVTEPTPGELARGLFTRQLRRRGAKTTPMSLRQPPMAGHTFPRPRFEMVL